MEAGWWGRAGECKGEYSGDEEGRREDNVHMEIEVRSALRDWVDQHILTRSGRRASMLINGTKIVGRCWK